MLNYAFWFLFGYVVGFVFAAFTIAYREVKMDQSDKAAHRCPRCGKRL